MWKQKLGISLGNHFQVPTEQVAELVKYIGFDAVSPVWEQDVDLDPVIRKAKECGLALQSLHGPVSGAAKIWSRNKMDSCQALDVLLAALEDCRRYEIPIMVLHPWIGYENIPEPTNEGLEHYETLVEKASGYGIQLAFENAEGEPQLAALMEHFAGQKTVGFCWDSGHEQCYNHFQDMLGKYGERLIMCHLNDNLGISSFDGTMRGRDDLHLLPFDGVGDWDFHMSRLQKYPSLEYLNFEVKIKSKPGRYESLCYERMALEEYFAECYKRACRVACKLKRGAIHGENGM